MKQISLTDIVAEHQRQVQELTQRIDAVTKQRDALLDACRKLAEWVPSDRSSRLERLLEEMKDVVITVDTAND